MSSDSYGVDFWFNTTMTVQQIVKTRDAGGTWTETFSNVATGVPCRVRAKTGMEAVIQGKLSQEITHRVYCHPLSVTLLAQKYRLVIASGLVLDIVFPNDPHEEQEFLQIDCVERT